MSETKHYIVENISGDYATLRLSESDDTILVAMAFLPIEIDEGTKLVYKDLEYSIE